MDGLPDAAHPRAVVHTHGQGIAADMVALRNWLLAKRSQMDAFGAGDLPLASASFSARPPHAIAVGGDPDAPSVYEDPFDGFRWIEDANLTGFLDMKLTSRPEEPGFLLARTHPDRAVEATLTYRFDSHFPLRSVQVNLAGAAPSDAEARNQIALSLDEREWTLQDEQAGNRGLYRDWLTLQVPAEELGDMQDFDVHINLRSTSGAESGMKACAAVWALNVRAIAR